MKLSCLVAFVAAVASGVICACTSDTCGKCGQTCHLNIDGYSKHDEALVNDIINLLPCSGRQDKTHSSAEEIAVKNINDSNIVFSESFKGPECIAVKGHNAYLGAEDGYIYEVDLQNLKDAKKLTRACDAPNVTQCRPGGIRVTSDNKMYFADDAGLCVYDFDTGRIEILIPTKTRVDDEAIMTINDLDVDEEEGIVYFSVPSSEVNNTYILRTTILQEKSSRVLAYDTKSKAVTVLAAGISFANGVQISHDKSFLVVCEFNKKRLVRVELSGDSRGSSRVFTENTFGNPDNIRLSSDGGYWVALNLGGNGKPFYDSVAENRCAAENFMKLNDLVSEYVSMIGRWTGRKAYTEVATELKTNHFLAESNRASGQFIKIDQNGKVTAKYRDANYGFISTAIEYEQNLLCGSSSEAGFLFLEDFLAS